MLVRTTTTFVVSAYHHEGWRDLASHMKMYKDKEVKNNVKNIFLSMCDVKVFLTFTFTEYGTVLTPILPILFLYLNTVIVTAGDIEP